ncbi:MAG TPA: GNAT family N-acetyltransferase [Thermoleophilaceae bacterium]|nr:GNAT family N-acetyltransferase [Thermoleophilaceae bacterium]
MPELPFPDPPLTDGVVTLRAWAAADADDIAACCQDPEIPRWTHVPSPYGREDAQMFLAESERSRLAGDELSLAVTDAEGGELLGAIGVRPGAGERGAEIGYWVARRARRRGTATRALRLLSEWAVRELGAERVQVVAHPFNEASQQVALRAGFRREGLLRKYQFRKGAWEDRVAFSLVAGDLEPRQVHFRPVADLRPAAETALAVHRDRIFGLVPEAEVEEMGATAVPGSLSKGDLDLLVRVPAGTFPAAREALGGRYAVHQLENWSPTFAGFKEELSDGLPVGVQLVVAESDDDRILRGTRDALRERPELLERYNELKRSFEGGDPQEYWRAKTAFLDDLWRSLR